MLHVIFDSFIVAIAATRCVAQPNVSSWPTVRGRRVLLKAEGQCVSCPVIQIINSYQLWSTMYCMSKVLPTYSLKLFSVQTGVMACEVIVVLSNENSCLFTKSGMKLHIVKRNRYIICKIHVEGC